MSPFRVLLFVLAAVAAASGCQSCCAAPPLHGGPDACTIGTCSDGNAFRFGSCEPGGCSTDNDCCPGSRCRADVNSCSPLLLDTDYECTTNADCKDPAQRCIPTKIGDRDPLPTCVFETCTGDTDCGFGRACFQGRCVDTAPCGGSCPSGSACDLITSQCAPYPVSKPGAPPPSPGCDADCPANQIKMFSDPDTMSGEQCCGLACTCVGLPPIVPQRFGRYSRVVVAAGEVQVSAYDGEFGDLVLAHFGLDGAFSRLDYLDGIPAGAAVTADPNGPRGGISDAGPNVGTHTSIAANTAGKVRIAYHDEDGKALKVAIQQDDNTFKSFFVDGGDAGSDFGQWTDIAVDNAGLIYITYFVNNAQLPGATTRSSGIKLATSKNGNPQSATDFTLTVVDSRPLFDPCNAACTAGQQCVLNGGAAQCLNPTTGCSPSCSSTQT
ncbi:MAG TPA: hypothetical protein VGO62_08200, partial [Myxococcota bacterium]